LSRTAPASIQSSAGWGRFITQIQKDLKLWFFTLGLLTFFRWLMIFIFRDQLGPSTSWLAVLRCSAEGFRFDASVATYWVLLPLAMSAACALGDFTRLADRVRFFMGMVMQILTTLLCFASFGFFQEYHDQFNHW